MKVTCDQSSLSFAVNTVNKAVTHHNTLPVLNNILIKAEGKKLFLAATNLEIAITYLIDCDVKNEGSITIPSKLFTNYISLLESGKVDLKLEEGWNLHIKSPLSETKIKGINPEEFPLIPKIEKSTNFKLNNKKLIQAITQTAFCSSLNISRPALTGILFSLNKDSLQMVATDSYRLSQKDISLTEKNTTTIQCIVPAKTIIELGKILSAVEDKETEVHISSTQILFKVGTIELISRLIEATFPDYEKIIPKGKKTEIEVMVSDFIKAVRKVSLFVAETSNNIKLSVTNDGVLLLSTDETQIGEGKAEVVVKVKGENNKIALNAQYLLEFLNSSGLDKLTLELNDKISPAVFKPLNDKDFLHIIMPLKL